MLEELLKTSKSLVLKYLNEKKTKDDKEFTEDDICVLQCVTFPDNTVKLFLTTAAPGTFFEITKLDSVEVVTLSYYNSKDNIAYIGSMKGE